MYDYAVYLAQALQLKGTAEFYSGALIIGCRLFNLIENTTKFKTEKKIISTFS